MSSHTLLSRLIAEKNNKISGGIYHAIQVRMTYNSNRIEGSKLSQDQTRLIFDTRTLSNVDGVLVDDVLETIHHFTAINSCIDHAEDQLTEDFIKDLHIILKHDTHDADQEWFAVGDYKQVPNVVGAVDTVPPEQVSDAMKELLGRYNSLEKTTIEDIIAFHATFEAIHPFQDGNGRVGRLVAFQQCLNHGIVLFIIEDSKKCFIAEDSPTGLVRKDG